MRFPFASENHSVTNTSKSGFHVHFDPEMQIDASRRNWGQEGYSKITHTKSKFVSQLLKLGKLYASVNIMPKINIKFVRFQCVVERYRYRGSSGSFPLLSRRCRSSDSGI